MHSLIDLEAAQKNLDEQVNNGYAIKHLSDSFAVIDIALRDTGKTREDIGLDEKKIWADFARAGLRKPLDRYINDGDSSEELRLRIGRMKLAIKKSGADIEFNEKKIWEDFAKGGLTKKLETRIKYSNPEMIDSSISAIERALQHAGKTLEDIGFDPTEYYSAAINGGEVGVQLALAKRKASIFDGDKWKREVAGEFNAGMAIAAVQKCAQTPEGLQIAWDFAKKALSPAV